MENIKKAVSSLFDAAQSAKRKAVHELHNKERQKREGIDKETAKILEMRANVVKELFETENTYLEQLKVLMKLLVEPLNALAAEPKGDSALTKTLSDSSVSACLNGLPAITEITSKIRFDGQTINLITFSYLCQIEMEY